MKKIFAAILTLVLMLTPCAFGEELIAGSFTIAVPQYGTVSQVEDVTYIMMEDGSPFFIMVKLYDVTDLVGTPNLLNLIAEMYVDNTRMTAGEEYSGMQPVYETLEIAGMAARYYEFTFSDTVEYFSVIGVMVENGGEILNLTIVSPDVGIDVLNDERDMLLDMVVGAENQYIPVYTNTDDGFTASSLGSFTFAYPSYMYEERDAGAIIVYDEVNGFGMSMITVNSMPFINAEELSLNNYDSLWDGFLIGLEGESNASYVETTLEGKRAIRYTLDVNIEGIPFSGGRYLYYANGEVFSLYTVYMNGFDDSLDETIDTIANSVRSNGK
ncbi:MAG: hypothetical protein IJC48_11445 [Clostridia bacterium]|nr:hypothetical protein [Clostridia bacterium]